MSQNQDAAPAPDPDPWSGLAALSERPQPGAAELTVAEPAATPVEPESEGPLAEALLQLTATLDDERRLRLAAEQQVRLGIAEIARTAAELDAERARIAQVERDRDEVLQRAEELLTGMRDRADQRVAAEVAAANRHWSELLVAERRRAERLDGELAGIRSRLEQAWMTMEPNAAPRRTRPRQKPKQEAGAVAPAPEPVPGKPDAPDSETTELAAEMDDLRQRLRTRLRKAPEMDDVEDGVDALREARLARDKDGRRRR